MNNNNYCIHAASSPKDAALDSEDLNVLKSVYKKLLGLDETTTIEMPFTIAQFKSIRVGSELYGSLHSEPARNSFVVATWTGADDIRPGQVLTFFRHCIKIKSTLPNPSERRCLFYMARANTQV